MKSHNKVTGAAGGFVYFPVALNSLKFRNRTYLNMALSFLIVDDEELSRSYISDLLNEFWPEARIAGSVGNTDQARKLLMEDDIDVLFLDIKMPGENGIEFINSIKNRNHFKTIFITAYNNFTIPAIKAAAFDYLLKPVDKTEFQQTLNRIKESFNNPETGLQKTGASGSLHEQKLTVHHSNGFKVIALGDIVYLQASNNYTNIRLISGETVVVSKPLKEFQLKLDNGHFFRIHKSYIININYVDQYLSDDGGQVIMKTGENIYISRYKLSGFFDFVAAFTKGLKA